MHRASAIALVLLLTGAPVDAACPSAPGAGDSSTLAGNAIPLHLEWYRPVLDRPIGQQGLAVGDLDGDGGNEIVTSSNRDTWVILRKQVKGYEQVWASLPSASQITALRVARIGGENMILVGYADGKLELVDGVNHRSFRTLTVDTTGFYGLRVANIDLDPAPEAVFCDGDAVHRIDLESGAAEPPLAFDCTDVAVGQVDLDAALEIVVATEGDGGYVLAADGTVEWTFNVGFGYRVEARDLDLDGRDEIVAAEYWLDGITVYDGVTHASWYTVPVHNLDTLVIGNVDADPFPEILYGDAQWGEIHVLEAADGHESWTVANPNHGVPGLAIGNLDADAAPEVVWAGGDGSRDALFVVDAATRLTEWESTDVSGHSRALGGADVDDDGRPEIYYASPTADYGDSGIYEVRDGATKTLERAGSPGTLANFLSIKRMTTADVGGSPAHELFFAGRSSFNGRMVSRSLEGGQIWAAQIPLGEYESLAIADVDGDGSLEVVAAGRVSDSQQSPGTYLWVHDAATGALEWQSPSMPTSGAPQYSLLRLANVDADPAVEAVVAGLGGRLWVWDLQAHVNQQITLDLDILGLDTPNLDGLGPAEILVGTATGLIRTIDAVGDPHTIVGPVGTPVNSLVAHDFTGDGTLDYLYACEGDLVIRDGVDGSAQWSSGFLGDDAGLDDTVKVGDFDGDGETEVLVALARGVAMFGNDDRDAGLLRDGFETGTFFKWTHE